MKALITGASSGIGRDMARYLAKKGWELILVARRADRLNELKDELDGAQVHCISLDVGRAEDCRRLYESVRDEQIDMLVNNAGFGLAGEFSETDLDTELNMIDVNVRAVHILTKLFLRDFIERDRGIILNVASSAGFMPGPLLSTYYATKNYVLRLTEAIYEELRRRGSHVKISALCPGPVNTEFNRVAKVKFAVDGISSEECAKTAIDGAIMGKLVIIPGTMMKAGLFFRRFVPEKTLLKLAYGFQRRKNVR
ncbi:SDR family NAD(P)-dependent oxidoreductase [Ruminococcus sp.]|uniref:SDR family NAD(P)-dependent oxidoreductase n=1 Tax=Ruminococcus sp. TaxID=41978 RepID=UPI00388DFFBA